MIIPACKTIGLALEVYVSLCNDRCPECQRKIFEEAMKPKKKKCKDCGGEYEDNWAIKTPFGLPYIPYEPPPRYGYTPIPMHDPNCQIEVAKNGWWSTIPPRCTCGLFIYPEPTKTKTTTGTI